MSVSEQEILDYLVKLADKYPAQMYGATATNFAGVIGILRQRIRDASILAEIRTDLAVEKFFKIRPAKPKPVELTEAELQRQLQILLNYKL